MIRNIEQNVRIFFISKTKLVDIFLSVWYEQQLQLQFNNNQMTSMTGIANNWWAMYRVRGAQF